MTDGKNRPVKKFRSGVLSVAIWKNSAVSKQTGQPVDFYTISLDRRYTDKDDNWQSTQTLRVNDLPKMTLLLQKAYEYLVLNDIENDGEPGPGTESGSGANAEPVPPIEEVVM